MTTPPKPRGQQPAEARQWPEGPLGDRFFTGTYLEEARNAPASSSTSGQPARASR